MTTAVPTRARHRPEGTDGISAAELLARYSEAGFDRPSRASRRAAAQHPEALDTQPDSDGRSHDDGTVVSRDVPAGLGAPAPAGLIRGRTSETGAFGRNPRAVVATMGATLVGATAVMGVVTSLGSGADADPAADLGGIDQATLKLAAVDSTSHGRSAAGSQFADGLNRASGMVPAAFDQADAARIAANNLAAAKKGSEARAAAAQQAAANASRSHGGGDDAAPAPSASGSSMGMQALSEAKSRLGMPYVWGADGPTAFDCSGLMKWAFEQIGKDLPRSSSAQSQVGKPVSKGDLKPGDLVFFYSPVSHVGIYAGNGKVLHASESGEPVKYSDIDHMPFHNARRI